MPHVKLSKRDFDFYYRLLHTISVVSSKLRNCTTNISCIVLNISGPLKPTILKFSSIFIEFRYSLSISGAMSEIEFENSNNIHCNL